jgi:inhibitor of cysteine peptidase
MKKIILVVLGLLITASVIGVTGASPGPGNTITLDASYSGSLIELAVDDTLKVELESNLTTGFEWVLVENSEGTVLQIQEQKYVMDDAGDPPLPGTGGTEVWIFKALASGETTISMEYSQPWEGGEKAIQTFELKVVVS